MTAAYNFDVMIDRSQTRSTKWGKVPLGEDVHDTSWSDECYGEDPLLPLWVADMDFPVPRPVIAALVARAQHGIFGYGDPDDSYYQAVINWMQRQYGWQIEAEWISLTPGVVAALRQMVRAFVAPGEGVLIQPPVYYPFYDLIEQNGARVVGNPLIYQDGRYQMDFEDLEEKCSDPSLKMAILCSPHNPVGRVWSAAELTRFGEICLKHGVLIAADELHSDLLLSGARFTPLATLSPEFADNALFCTSPSKSFNLAGLKTSNIITPNPALKARFDQELTSSGLAAVNVFGLTAVEAAYNHGRPWLEQLLAYLQGNLDFMADFLARELPQIHLVPLQGTYLAWLDCRALGLDGQSLRQLMFNEARVYLDEGYMFGPEGEGFERVNIACCRSLLAEALERIKAAVDKRGL